LDREEGELQFTSYGISGIPTFQCSRFAANALYEGKEVVAKLNFLPHLSFENFLVFFRNQQTAYPTRTLQTFFSGLINKKLAKAIISPKEMRSQTLQEFNDKQADHLYKLLTEYEVLITRTCDFDSAQVTCGGVTLSEVSSTTMESRIVPGLYFCGEILDVDGTCGGYNLQFAFSTGFIAGNACV